MQPEAPHKWGEERRGFHLDRTINIGHILTSMAMLIGFFTWATALENKVAVHDAAIESLSMSQSRYDDRIDSLRLEVKSDLNRVLGRVDQIYSQTSYLTRSTDVGPGHGD